MGNDLSVLLLGPDFEQQQLFPAALDAGCTVRDLVCFALTCNEARAFVCAGIAAISGPHLAHLLVSLPTNPERFGVHLESCLLLRQGDLVWERSSGSRWARLIRVEMAPSRENRGWGMYQDYGTVLFSVPVAPKAHMGNPFWPQFSPYAFQWYPLLDAAMRACVHRLTAPPTERLREDEEVMERARKRPRLLL